MKQFVIFFLIFFLSACRSSDKKGANNKPTYISNPFLSAATANIPDSVARRGRGIYYTNCNSCHKDSALLRAPGLDILNTLTSRAIVVALTTGKMRTQAEKLSLEDRRAVAQWITNKALTDNELPQDAYTDFSLSNGDRSFDQSGWGGNLEGTGFRSAQQAGISFANVSSLQLKWAFAFPDATQVRSKPAVIGNWLIVGSEFGDIYAINTQTGKVGWKFEADAAIRGAINITTDAGKEIAWFADYSTNVYSLDVKTGKLIWKKRTGIHPLSSITGSVAVFSNKVFVPLSSTEVISAINPDYNCCSSSGEVVALNTTTGDVVWRHRVVKEAAHEYGKKRNGKTSYGPSGGPVWCSPTVDSKRGLLYIGTGENYSPPATNSSDAIQALDINTGKLVWNFQATMDDTWNLACLGDDPNCPEKEGPDLDFGMAPLLVRRDNGNDILLAGQKSGVVHAIAADNGKVIWQTRIGKGGQSGGIHWGMATDGKFVYAANADNIRDLDIRNPAVNRSPGIYAIDIETGRIIWKAEAPPCGSRKGCYQSNSAAPTVIPEVVFAGSLDGHIRAYAAKDGKVLWEFDTVKEFSTVNGVVGKGGALDGSAPVVANGMLFVNSGYGLFGQIPGNVLLAFEVKK